MNEFAGYTADVLNHGRHDRPCMCVRDDALAMAAHDSAAPLSPPRFWLNSWLVTNANVHAPGVVGAPVGAAVGAMVGVPVGARVGAVVGVTVGAVEGVAVGVAVGAVEGAAVGVAVGAADGATVGVALGDWVGGPAVVQLQFWTTFVSNAIAALNAISLPCTLPLVVNVMLASAMRIPLNVLDVPRVALVPTSQNTLHGWAPPVKATVDPAPVVSEVPMKK